MAVGNEMEGESKTTILYNLILNLSAVNKIMSYRYLYLKYIYIYIYRIYY